MKPALLRSRFGRATFSPRTAATGGSAATPILDWRHPRFPRLRALIPRQVVLAWPEFLLDGQWVAVSKLYGDLGTLRAGDRFTDTVGETLFDAIVRTAVDWDGSTNLSG
ncbi:hypothetical protein [Streptosporangium roseum]|uniref:hypothetical protein n=1 Tax=Streptosporangium roseum TaxID=2001 RepID=UPI003325D490